MRFEKWQALGNDYLIVEQDELPFELTPERVRWLCAPHTGVGSDGVLLLSEADERGYVARLRIFNPDGSEAELSGNGVREAVMYLRRNGWTDDDSFSLRTAAGEVRPRQLFHGEVPEHEKRGNQRPGRVDRVDGGRGACGRLRENGRCEVDSHRAKKKDQADRFPSDQRKHPCPHDGIAEIGRESFTERAEWHLRLLHVSHLPVHSCMSAATRGLVSGCRALQARRQMCTEFITRIVWLLVTLQEIDHSPK